MRVRCYLASAACRRACAELLGVRSALWLGHRVGEQCEFGYGPQTATYEGGDTTGVINTLAGYVNSFDFADQLLGQFRLCELTDDGDL